MLPIIRANKTNGSRLCVSNKFSHFRQKTLPFKSAWRLRPLSLSGALFIKSIHTFVEVDSRVEQRTEYFIK